MTLIYEPSEDTYFLCEVLGKNVKDKSMAVLEVGVGSGYILEFLKEKGFKKLEGVDINPKSVKVCKDKGLNVFESNLFSNIKGKYNLIIFNSPYLPEDNLEDSDSAIATTGGKKGGELINKFLRKAENHLKKNGKILLLISSLTKGINFRNYTKKLIGEKKLFYEKLEIWELSI
ncbi:methyltransferase [Candidatus Pacearchaeota archaeon]|nr:hypothetical protein [uncultured archaeon]MBS3084494.1 methyltransferase [Candidatus Pacearchaeota archaeon]